MDLKTLKKTRAGYKSKLTLFKSYLHPLLPSKELTSLQVHELNLRLTRVQEMYNNFDSIQIDIENVTDIPEEEYSERQAFEDGYFSAVAAAQELLSRHRAEPASAGDGDLVTASSEASAPAFNNKGIRLPVIHLPVFSGCYHDWLEFHGTFKSLIHTNTSISKIQKFHYLRASLKDSAALIIQAIEFTADGYDIAWGLLCDRYNNERLLINNHISALFNIETLLKESSKSIRNVIDTVNKNLRALKALNLPTEHWDVLIIHMISSKLDRTTIRYWEEHRNDLKNIPTLDDFNIFLKNRADLLETMEDTHQPPRRHSDITHVRQKTFVTTSDSSQGKNTFICPICKNNHAIYHCTKFKSMPIETRIQRVQQLNLCINCLRKGHATNQCKLGPCRLCSEKHNTMLHTHQKPADHKQQSSESVVLPISQSRVNADSHSSDTKYTKQSDITLSTTHQSQVLLSTAIINIADHDGHLHQVRALLDNGSTSSFITENLHNQLNLPSYSTSVSVQGLNNQFSRITKRCDVSISSQSNSGYTANINCFIVPHITQLIPTTKINCNSFNIPKQIHLADPSFNTPSEVQILLGADLFWQVITHNYITLGKFKPTLVETKFGWLVSGSIQTQFLNKNHSANTVHCNFTQDIELQEKLNRFFEFESIHTPQQSYNKGESESESIFKQTTVRQADGRFIVTIPLREPPESLGDSRAQALSQFLSLERKLQHNSTLKQKYTDFMNEYISLGHMTENTDTQSDKVSYFLPHHGVLRENSLTTKLRVVFNASMPTSSGKSFNSIQYTGDIVQDDLVGILIRFRQHTIVVTCDIEKFFRMPLITEGQRSLQQIFWRSDPSQEIKQYKLNTVTYGTASAPFLATRCLAQLGIDCSDTKVSETILHDFYVDDLVTGDNSGESIIHTCKGVIKELEGAHFYLRKWRSNQPSILSQIVDESSNDDLLILNKDDHSKTLGLFWSSKTDTLLFSSINPTHTQIHKTSKRTILSTIAQIFDPLGLINPCMLQAKLILQTLWSKNIAWDDQLPDDIEIKWNSFVNTLSDLTTIQIPRHVLCNGHDRIELHAFSDASTKAYSACIYIRSVSSNGTVSVHLILAKGRVNPLRQKLTIPRLELTGAVLAIHLAKKVENSLRLQIHDKFFWCDSTIVLGWIKTRKQILKQFVYNRVKEITNYCPPSSWNYVPSELNPADIGSRGLSATQLKDSSLWWNGPYFLHDTHIQYPIQPQGLDVKDLPEIKITCQFSTQDGHSHEQDFTHRFSNYSTLLHVSAYILRFIHNCRNPKNKLKGSLTVSELRSATMTLCKIVQKSMFCKQYTQLANKHTLGSKDKLLYLNPFMDNYNIMRVGGRLSNSNYDYSTKYPILLHASHHITSLLVQYYHILLLHAGPQLLLATLRHKFWIINGRNLTRKITHNCIKCCRFSGKTFQPIMGNLPAQRLHSEYPFYNSAVDYAGPYMIADRKGRGCRLKKAYICIFVCLAVRAVHIELVTELTSQGFLAALNRFIARRGKPQNIYSDNGTNFVGASNELAKFLKSNSDSITSNSSEIEVKFHFYPAYSPHFNGLAEGSVKSVKHHLKRVLSMAHLDYEEMNTVLVQIESILNSRPLTPLSSDPTDLVPLTPAHFLIGRTITMLPASQVEDTSIHLLTRYNRTQALKSHFWSRYYKEYISELQRRNKWRADKGQPRPGDMVLIKDDRLPPNRWLLGRIDAVYPGSDGVARVADVHTTSGTIRRGFNRLCPLPILEQDVPRAAAC